MALFRIIASLYAKYDSRVTVTSLVMLFRNQITRYFTALRQYLLGSAKSAPPRLDAKTDIFQCSLDTFETSANQKVGGKVKTGEDKGRTGSTAKYKYGIDAAGNQIFISQLIKKIAPEESSDKEEEQGDSQSARAREERPAKSAKLGKRATPGSGGSKTYGTKTGAGAPARGGSSQLCFLCGQHGHMSRKCNHISEQEELVPIDQLPERLHEVAASVRKNLRSD